MKRPLVYLAGGIAGLAGAEATDWRTDAAYLLARRDVECLDPMRAKLHLAHQKRISDNFNDYANAGVFFTSRGIMTRDFNDVKRCDALLVNLLGLTRPSLGTVMELGWAYAMQKPAVVVMEAECNPHDLHPMIHEAISFRVETMGEGVDVVATVLNR